MVETAEQSKAGHRERLRQRFLASEAVALTDEAFLESLRCYVIALKDAQLPASPEARCRLDRTRSYSAAIIRLVADTRDRHVEKWASRTTKEPSWTKQTFSRGLYPAFGPDSSVEIPTESHR